MTGVYEIWIGDKFYQGRSIDIEARIAAHQATLKQGKHNKYMQAAWNKHQTFDWHVLVECDASSAQLYEQAFIDANLRLPNCMNLSDSANGGWKCATKSRGEGWKNNLSVSMTGRKHNKTEMEAKQRSWTPERRSALSDRNRMRWAKYREERS